MQYYYEIEEAWKLYVEQGVVKAESLNPSLLRMWELSKIAGASYDKKSLSLTADPSFQSKQSFTLSIEHYSYTNYLALFLVDETYFVHDICGIGLPNINIPIGSRLNIENMGYTALHKTKENASPSYLNYSENYIKALQTYETYAKPLELRGENYYILVLSLKAGLEERLGLDFLTLLKEFETESRWVDNLEGYKRRDFIHLFELSTEGIILSRLTNTKLNTFFDEGMDLSLNFSMLSLGEIVKGEKQFITSMSDKTKHFLLSPIKWNSASSILCQAEELESSYRAFFQLAHYGRKVQYFEAVPAEAQRRMRALFLSSYPSIISYRRERDLSFIIELISSYREEERFILSYEKERDVVNELCISRDKRVIHSHDLKAVGYHIIIGKTEKNAVDELARLIEETLKTKDRPYGLIFYVQDGLDKDIASKLEAEANLLEMQTMDFSTTELCNWIDSYYSTSGDSLSNAKAEPLDLLALERDGRAQYRKIKEESRLDSTNERTSKSFSIKKMEKQVLIDALTASNYNISEASRKLGISRASLYRKMKNYSISSPK